jgi:hypothetical protein
VGVLVAGAGVALYSVGLVISRPFALQLSRIVEPGHSWIDRLARALVHEAHAAAAERPGARDAVSEARLALDLSVADPWLARERREDTRRLAELLIATERFDELALLPREVAEVPVLLAEARRLRKDPAGAVESLRKLIEQGELPRRALASAHAVLALAEADLGHNALALAELAGLRVASRVQGPLLLQHGLARVAGYVEFKARTREPGQTP